LKFRIELVQKEDGIIPPNPPLEKRGRRDLQIEYSHLVIRAIYYYAF
jgi:hypothetical protein